jgi:hypothetical protein
MKLNVPLVLSSFLLLRDAFAYSILRTFIPGPKNLEETRSELVLGKRD